MTVSDRISETLWTTMDRRSIIKSLAGLGAAVALTPALGQLSTVSASSTDSRIVNTEGARLRSGPGTGYGIIASLTKGTEVRYIAYGGSANGFEWHKVMVLATGKQGFIAANLLSMPGSGPGSDPVIVGTAKTTASVNLRSGPSTGNSVLRVVPAGSVVQISNTVQSGYRYVIHDGLPGWIAAQYLGSGPSQPSGGTFTTTARLNLRSQPSSTASVLLVMPSGTVVKALSGTANGWRQVSYNGTVGWAATAYLN